MEDRKDNIIKYYISNSNNKFNKLNKKKIYSELEYLNNNLFKAIIKGNKDLVTKDLTNNLFDIRTKFAKLKGTEFSEHELECFLTGFILSKVMECENLNIMVHQDEKIADLRTESKIMSVLSYIKENPSITKKQLLEDMISINDTEMNHLLNKLLDKDLIFIHNYYSDKFNDTSKKEYDQYYVTALGSNTLKKL